MGAEDMAPDEHGGTAESQTSVQQDIDARDEAGSLVGRKETPSVVARESDAERERLRLEQREARLNALSDEWDELVDIMVDNAERPAYLASASAKALTDVSFWVSPAAVCAIHDAGIDASL